MKQIKSLLIAVVVIAIVFVGLYLVNKYKTRTFTQNIYIGKCGVQECHGMNLTCGHKVPDACTEMYQVGDGCQQFFGCTISKGTCMPVHNPKFDICKSCVQQCEKENVQNPEAVFQCDSQCIQKAITSKQPSPAVSPK